MGVWANPLVHRLSGICKVAVRGKFMIAATCMMNPNGQMREDAAEAYFSICCGATATLEHVATMIFLPEFQPRVPGTVRRGERYYDKVAPSSPVTIDPPESQEPWGEFEPLSSTPLRRLERGASQVALEPADEEQSASESDAPPMTRYDRIAKYLKKHRAQARRRAGAIFLDTEAEAADAVEEEEEEEGHFTDDGFADDRDSDDMSHESWY